MATAAIPFPPSSSSDRQYPPRQSSSSQPRPGQFFSTTTAPLRDREQEQPPRPSTSQPGRSRKSSNNSIGGQSSVLARGRPKAAQLQQQQRPNSFFDPANQAQPDAYPSGEGWNAQGGQGQQQGVSAGAGGEGGFEHQQGGARSRPDSFFGIEGPPSGGLHGSFPPEGVDDGSSVIPRGGAGELHQGQERRSSFYGLDAHLPPQTAAPPSRDYSPSPSHPSDDSHRNLPRHQSSSGSGSYSSHDNAGNPLHRPRHSQAPYASSRAASLYNYGSAGQDPSPPPPAQLLDQSHLRVGAMASLLSHDKTLELYRQNAKKTNDPDVQHEFCTFVMDVVADLEHAAAVEKAAAVAAAGGKVGEKELPPTEIEVQSRKKQQALVAESITLLNKLATRGHVKSQYFLADCYTQGIGTLKGKRDYDKAFPLFMLAGKHGHAAGSYRAAQCLENGWGCRKDLARSVSFYRRAAVLSHTPAMHRLGLAEINGELGLTKRPKDGVQWLKRAAELADQVEPVQPESLHELAILHEKGIDNVVFQDEEYAAELLARAAELQYAPSAYKLGECYEYGKMGCPQDSALSIHYYNIAAQQAHPAACFALTAWYLVGSPGVLPQSDTEAYLWAKKAAELGLAKAEYACGYFTEVGMGTYKDEREALEWFRKAATHGDKRAQDRLRMGGHAVPPPVVLEAPKRPALLPQPGHAATSSFHLPASASRTSRLLKKGGGKQGAAGRGASVDARPATMFGEPSLGAPVSDRKGKGKAKQHSVSHPGMVRQRSASQPPPVHPQTLQAGQHLDYNLRPVPVPVAGGLEGGDFGPLAYDHRQQPAATIGGHSSYPSSPTYGGQEQQDPRGGGGGGMQQPASVQLPARQGRDGSPVLGGQEREKREKEREKVSTLRKKGAGEDKDCVVM